jgi:hypothetical protein
MAMKLEELGGLMSAIGYRYLRDPDPPILVAIYDYEDDKVQIHLRLDIDGQYLQIRAPNLLSCVKDHRHLPALLAAITSFNGRCRSVRFTWDPSDGEIAAFTDAWPMDGKLTALQLQRLINLLVVTVNASRPRLRGVLETGDAEVALAANPVTHL